MLSTMNFLIPRFQLQVCQNYRILFLKTLLDSPSPLEFPQLQRVARSVQTIEHLFAHVTLIEY